MSDVQRRLRFNRNEKFSQDFFSAATRTIKAITNYSDVIDDVHCARYGYKFQNHGLLFSGIHKKVNTSTLRYEIAAIPPKAAFAIISRELIRESHFLPIINTAFCSNSHHLQIRHRFPMFYCLFKLLTTLEMVLFNTWKDLL